MNNIIDLLVSLPTILKAQVDNRKEYMVGRDSICGLTVSTVFTLDEGFETAIVDSKCAYPVERYKTKEEALEGHKRWCEKSTTLTEVTMLDGLNGLVAEETIHLVRAKNEFLAIKSQNESLAIRPTNTKFSN